MGKFWLVQRYLWVLNFFNYTILPSFVLLCFSLNHQELQNYKGIYDWVFGLQCSTRFKKDSCPSLSLLQDFELRNIENCKFQYLDLDLDQWKSNNTHIQKDSSKSSSPTERYFGPVISLSSPPQYLHLQARGHNSTSWLLLDDLKTLLYSVHHSRWYPTFSANVLESWNAAMGAGF